MSHHPQEVEPTPVKFADAMAYFTQGGFNIIDTLNPDSKGGWAVWDGELKTAVDRQAIYKLKEPLKGREGDRLSVTMKHRSDHSKHILGTFALATSSSPNVTFETETVPPADILAILNIKSDEWNNQQATAIAQFHRRSTQQHRDATARLRLAQTEYDRIKEGFQDTMVMRDRSEPRDTQILVVGRYDNPLNDEKLFPDTLASVAPASEDTPKNRLGLAQWIVSATVSYTHLTLPTKA